jgi:hypothetical protein
MYTTIYLYDFPARSSKLSSRSLRVGNKELLHTTQFQTTLYTKVRGTMRSLAGRCYYFSLKNEYRSALLALVCFGRAGSGSDFDTDQSRNVYRVHLIAFFFCKFALARRCFKSL